MRHTMTTQNHSMLLKTMGELSSVHNKLDYFDLNSQSPEEDLNFGGLEYLNQTLMNGTTPPPATRDEFLAKIEQSVLIIIFVLTIVGNFVVLTGIYFRKQKMTRMYYFIVHLAIADLTTAVFQVLTQLAWEITYRFRGGPFMCKFVKFVQIIGPYSSSYILVMTALDRYQAICYPLSNCSWTARRSKVMLWTAWIFSIACCVPQLFIFSFQEVSPNVFDCWATFWPGWGEKAYITWYCISVFIVPLIILIFAYTCITRVIWLNFSMKNAIIQEQKRSTLREDSDGLDEHEFDQSIEENDSSVAHENYKNSKKPSNERKLLMSNKHRHMEVSWHQKTSSTTTKTSMISTHNNRNSKQTNGNSNRQLKGPTVSMLAPNNATGHQRVGKKATRTLSPALSSVSQPRTHSVKGISRAKIKTIKLTVTVILCYVVCSTPFIAAMLWSTYDPYAKEHPFFYGPTFTILTLLASLNSCANAFIVLFFNPNLLQSFSQGTCGRFRYFSQQAGGSSSLTPSQRKQLYNNRLEGKGNNQRAATSVTGLSPLMNRFSPNKEYGNNRSRNSHDGIELTTTKSSKKVNIVATGQPALSSENENNYPALDSASRNTTVSPKETSFIGI